MNLFHRLKPSTLAALAVASLVFAVGCSHTSGGAASPAADANDMLPSAQREQTRISDGAIHADKRFLADLQQRLAALNAGGVPAKNYHLSKAGAWLDFAIEEYSDNDRTGVIEGALEQSVRLIRALEAKLKDMPNDTPIIKGSRRIRDDLWARVEQYKQHAEFVCVADRVALLEVQLVWAGHEDVEGGWRHAKPYIEIAEDMAAHIDEAFASCAKPKAAEPAVDKTPAKPEPPAAAPLPAPASASEPPAATQIVLSADTLFRFNGSATGDIQPAALKDLDALVQKLKSMGAIRRILITGHTDRLGDSAYNLRLSAARANTIRQVLLERGFAAELVQAAGAGESEPVVTCTGDRATPGLIDCLQANRRVEVRVFVSPANGSIR